MPEEIVKLRAEMDVSGVKKGAKEAERAVTDSAGKMDQATKRSAAEMLKVGENASRVAGLATAGFSSIAAGISAANANSENLGSSLVGIASSLTGAFLAGGPIGLGVGLLATGIGLLAGQTDDAAEAAKRAEAAHTSWLTKAKSQADAAAQAIGRIEAEIEAAASVSRGDPVSTAQIMLERQVEAAHTELQRLRKEATDLLTSRVSVIGAEMRPDEKAAFERVTKQRELLAKLTQQLHTVELKRRTDNQAARDEANRQIRVEIALLKAKSAEERFALEQEEFRRKLEGQPLGAHPLLIDDLLAQRQAEFDKAQAAEREAKAREHIRRVVQGIGADFDKLEDSLDKQEAATRAATENLDRQLEIMATRTPLERDQAILAQQVSQLRKAGVDEARVELFIRQRMAQIDRAEADRKAREDAKARAKREAEEKAAKAVASAREALNNAIRLEIRLLGAANNEERERIRILADIDAKRKAGADQGLLDRLRAARLAALETGNQEVDDSARRFVESLAPTISGGLTDLIMDGIENGFENGADIARAIWSQLLRSIINQLITSGLDSIIGSLFGGGGGGGLGGIGGVISAVTGIGGGGGAGSVAEAAEGC